MWGALVLLCAVIHKCSPGVVFTNNEDVYYQVVGVFEKEALVQMKAFNESLRYANSGDLRIDPQIIKPYRADSYSFWRELCSRQDILPIVVFGPQSPTTDGAIRDQCALANIPHIQATWQPNDPDMETTEDPTETEQVSYYFKEVSFVEEEEDPSETEDQNAEQEFKRITINFFPDADELAMAYSQLLRYYNWESFAVLYEDDFGLMRVQKILANLTEKFPVTVRRLDPSGSNYKIFKELIKYQESRFLLDCHANRIKKYMDEASALHMVNHYQHYILVSMDTSIVSEELRKYPSNITWLSITDYDKLKDPQHFLSQRVGRWVSETDTVVTTPVTTIETEVLMIDDIANHVLKALQNLTETTSVKAPIDPPCGERPWFLGARLQQEILNAQSKGVSGQIQFNEKGKRFNYTLYMNEIHVSKRETIGRWRSIDGMIIEDRAMDSVGGQQTSKHFVVISRKAKPYYYNKPKTDEPSEDYDDGDEEYEGFSVDLVREIFKILKNEMNYNYTYSFSREEHYAYGKLNTKTKKWDGLIGDLLDKKADLAVCDLTITEERKKVVDFSVPIMTLGISILYTKEHKVKPGTFSFLNPYSFEVWIYTATAYCVVSIVLFVCSRISPADWENPQPCDKDPEELENIWNFKNCTWLTMGSIMTQGCDILPKAVGSRWVCGMWWFFAMIVCQTYIAQLAASMTSALENEPINSVEDLAKQNKIMYGAIVGGSTLEFFKNSKDKMYHRMYENMMANPVVFVRDNDEGEKRVLNGKNKYAFFMESSTIAYKLRRNCDLKQIGNELDSKDYGIAMPANSPFRSQINRAILKLKERTKLDEIKAKWWERKYGATECSEDKDESDVEGDLEMENLVGAFLVLVVGLVFCVFISAAEFMNEVRNIVVREQVSHKEAFIQELKASLNFFQLQKPVLRNPSRAPSIASSAQSEEKQEKQNLRATALSNFMDSEKLQQ